MSPLLSEASKYFLKHLLLDPKGAHLTLAFLMLLMRKLMNSGVSRISRGSTPGSDMPSALGLFCDTIASPSSYPVGD